MTENYGGYKILNDPNKNNFVRLSVNHNICQYGRVTEYILIPWEVLGLY